jgi:membrane associated rhomboid family serine protease
VIPLRDVNPTRTTPYVTLAVIAVCVLVFFFVQNQPTEADVEAFLYRRAAISCELTTANPLTPDEIIEQTCSSQPGAPLFPEKSPWISVLTSLFLHGGLAHLGFNMWFLWIFGNNVEEAFGHFRYALLYIVGGIVATGAFVAANPESTVPLVGASGAIAAALGAYGVLFPGHRVLTLVGWFLIPMPASIFLAIWFVLQFGLGGTGTAWEAHVGGFLFGLIVAGVFRRSLLRRVSYAGRGMSGVP